MKEKIKLNYDLAVEVLKILRKSNNISSHDTLNGIYSLEFTYEEIETITFLDILNPVDNIFKDINKLFNLKSLSIKTLGDIQFKTVRQTSSINDNELREICKCINLESLKIENQSNITKIDLSNLSNLNSLIITRNINLENIIGLDKINALRKLSIYGNESLSNIKHLDKTIQNNNFIDLNLEILLYPDATGYNGSVKDNVFARNKLLRMKEKCSWIELKDENTSMSLTTLQMKMLHEQSLSIARSIIEKTNTKLEYISLVCMYINKNYIFDRDGFISSKHMLKRNDLDMGPINGTYSTFNAIIFNEVSPLGYLRGLRYLLKLAGIKTRNIVCKLSSNNINKELKDIYTNTNYIYNILSIKDIDNLYCDPFYSYLFYKEEDIDNMLNYILINKTNIRKTHELSYIEKSIESNSSITKEDLLDIYNKYKNI